MQKSLPLQMNSSMVFVGEVVDNLHCFIMKSLPGVRTRSLLPKHIGIYDIMLASSEVLVIMLEDRKIIHLNLNGIIVDQTDVEVKRLMKEYLYLEGESQQNQSQKYIEFREYPHNHVLCYNSSGFAKKVAEYKD